MAALRRDRALDVSRHDHPDDGRRLGAALAVTLGVVVLELVAGLVAHSLALVSDAGHVLADAVALGGSIWAVRLARRPSTPSMSYGLKRAEILAAAANGVVLAVVAVGVAVEAAQRLAHPVGVDGPLVIGAASVALCANLLAARVLAGTARRSMNVRAALLHVSADAAADLAALVAGVLVVTLRWHRADPVASLVVVAILCRGAWTLLRAAGHVLLEGTPETVDLDQVRRHLEEHVEVLAVHDLHAWTLTSDVPALTAHVVVRDACFADGSVPSLLDRLQACIADHFDVEHSTFQLEAASHVDHEEGTHA